MLRDHWRAVRSSSKERIVTSPGIPVDSLTTGATLRAIGFLSLWLVLSGAHIADLPAAAVAIGAATWTSLRLLPPGAWRLSPVALAEFVLRFLRQSIVAGVDVAWRALDPRLPLRPGFVAYRLRIAAGPARNAFCDLSSLLPGTLPAGSDDSGALLVHCLDVDQPVAAQMAAEEALLIRVFGMQGDV
jgi:multicomponent Na+:H+ antiporter subunit E